MEQLSFVGDKQNETLFGTNKVLTNLRTITHKDPKEETLLRLQYILKEQLVFDENNNLDAEKYLEVSDTIHAFDFSLGAKLGVHIGLFAGALSNIGTKKHTKLIQSAYKGEIYGCFAMTEFGHGSDLRNLETVALFNPIGRTFTIHTPSDSAQKYWVGNAGSHAHVAVVFAKLIVNEKSFGIHCFIVPLRKPNGEFHKGIYAVDCGDKAGLNGVDNGRIWFDNVVIPYDNLLDRFITIGWNGEVQQNGNFGNVLSELIGGRVVCASSSNIAARICLYIALNYASWRIQFDKKLIDYTSHRKRLIPLLAETIVIRSATENVKKLYCEEFKEQKGFSKKLHAIASGIKAISTWSAMKVIQVCRECCGGHGYSTLNQFSKFRNDCDIYTTLEGDNTVLLQQSAGYLVKQFINKHKTEQVRTLLYKSHIINFVHEIARRNLHYKDYHHTLLSARVSYLTAHLVILLRNETWNRCLPTALHLARAASELYAFECCSHSIVQLYGVTAILNDIQFFIKTRLVTAMCINTFEQIQWKCINEISENLKDTLTTLNVEQFVTAPIVGKEICQTSLFYLKPKL